MDLAEFMSMEDVAEVRCTRVPIDTGGASGAAGGGAGGEDAGGSEQASVFAQEGALHNALLVHATPVSAVAPRKRKAPAPRATPSRRRKLSAREIAERDVSTFIPADEQSRDARGLADESSEETEDDVPLRRTRAPDRASGVARDAPILLDDNIRSSPPRTSSPQPDPVLLVDHWEDFLSVSTRTAAMQYGFLQRILPPDLRNQIAGLDSRAALRAQTQATLLNLAFASDGLSRAAAAEGRLRAVSARADAETAKCEALNRRVAEVEEELRTAKAACQVAEEDKRTLQVSLEHAQDEIDEAQQAISTHLRKLDQITQQRNAAEVEFACLQEGLPRLAANILRSRAVRQPFGELLMAVREAERLKTLNLISPYVVLPEPLPEAIAAQINPSANERLARASAALANIEIPALNALSEDISASADNILDAEL